MGANGKFEKGRQKPDTLEDHPLNPGSREQIK